MQTTITINVGRIRSCEGGFEIHLPDGQIVRESDGGAFTAERAEEVLGEIDRYIAERN